MNTSNLNYVVHDQDPICWFCSSLISSNSERFICKGPCSRIFHKSCLNNDFIAFLKTSKSKNSVYAEVADFRATSVCFNCIRSYVGCDHCKNIVPVKRLVKCCISSCNHYYCKDSCVSEIRYIYLNRNELTLYFNNMRLPLEVLDISDENLICYSHFCFCCYDCDKYMYTWERNWRIGLYKSGQMNETEKEFSIAWDFLRRTCKGSIELSYFNKGKLPVKPPRMPTVSRINIPINSTTLGGLNVSDITKSTQNIIYTCIRCDRGWCVRCLPPDASYLLKCKTSIICQDCLQQQLDSELSLIDSNADLSDPYPNYISLSLHTNSQNIYSQLRYNIIRNRSKPSYISTRFDIESESDINDDDTVKDFENFENEDKNVLDENPMDYLPIDSNYCSEEVKNILRTQTLQPLLSDISNIKNLPEGFPYNSIDIDSTFKNKKNILYVSKAGNKGLGVFTSKHISEGEFICEYIGELSTHSYYQKKLLSRCFKQLDDEEHTHWYIMKINRELYIDSTTMGDISRYINHSCDPNCVSVPIKKSESVRMCIFAKRPIKPGEELTYNYGFQPVGLNGFDCYCGSENCRLSIGGTKTDYFIDKVVDRRINGSTSDSLGNLIKEFQNVFVNNNSTLNPKPIPLDIINGIFNSNDLRLNDTETSLNKLKKYLNICSKIKRIISNNTQSDIDYVEIYNLLKQIKREWLPLPFGSDVKPRPDIEFLYTKLIAMNKLSLDKFSKSRTRKYGTDIPWSILAFENNGQKSFDETSNFDTFNSAKRFIQRYSLINAGKRFGRMNLAKIQNLFDLSWGVSESCLACGGYGNCIVCDSCAGLFHDKNFCGDFAISPKGEVLCGVCQNTNHRRRWFLFENKEREALAKDLALCRLSTLFNCGAQVDNSINSDFDIYITDYKNYVNTCNNLISNNPNFFNSFW